MRNFLLIILALTLPACSQSLYQEGTLTPSRAQVLEHDFYQQVALSDVNEGYLQNLARHFDKQGKDALHLEVVYDPAVKSSAMATHKAKALEASLRGYGVRSITSSILPVSKADSLIVSYHYYTAQKPENCTMMPGYADTDIRPEEDYNLGCTVETLIARQISRPGDLLGRGNTDYETDGRSAANLVNHVRSGAFNEALGGEQASDN